MPHDKLEEIRKQGNYVNEAKEILIKNEFPPIYYLPNLHEVIALSNIEGSVLNITQIRNVLSLSEMSRKVKSFVSLMENETSLFRDFASLLFADKSFEGQVARIFTESGDIRDDASPKLREIRSKINERSQQLEKTVNRILKQLSKSYVVQEEYVTQRDGRLVVPIRAEHKRHVRGFIHSESATGQTVYIEPEETLELNNEILSLNFAERREIERILRVITARISEVSLELRRSLNIIAEIDSIFAKAKYSLEMNGAFPSFDQSKPFELIDARHPILLNRLGRKLTVPVNAKISEDKVVLITGPNAGGKTVVLKTIGLHTIMAMAGLHIPADPDSNLYFCTKLLIDIGDQQSIEDDLSTFSSHLANMKSILENADEQSIVLLDELGTGTDPSEGAALATAILMDLLEKQSLVFATTHHGNLKVLANDIKGFQNASMKFDAEELKPTYEFRQGIPGSSYAFEVAERIGFNEEIIKLAKEHLDTDKNRIEEFLVDLEKKSNDIRDKLSSIELENTRLKGLTKLYQEKIEKIEKKKKEIINNTREKAESYLRDVNSKIEAAIKNIRESQAAKEVIIAEKENIKQIKKKANKLAEKRTEKGMEKAYSFSIGDYASIRDTHTSGEILEINGKKVVLAAGAIKVNVKIADLIPAKKEKPIKKTEVYSTFLTNNRGLRLDIRGYKPEEAEMEVIKFIDDNYSDGAGQIEILHGKGTGVLKKTVHDILKRHEFVKNYSFAKIEVGGDGVTIVDLK